MVLLDELLQPFSQEMRVNLGRRDIGMTEQHLQAAQIRAPREKMGRKGMPQHVRRDTRRINACFQDELLELQKESLARQRPNSVASGK